MKISYNWLQSHIEGELPEPKSLERQIIFHAFEVEEIEEKKTATGSDFIFDIKTLPDRNHDCLSHQGMAREIAGLTGLSYKDPSPLYTVPKSKPTKLEIEIQSSACRRYMARIVRNVTVKESPQWVKDCLESIGQRSINNIVDATNIVMYDCGQPCHAFDLKKIKGNKIIIRSAREKDEISLIHDTVYTKGGVAADRGRNLIGLPENTLLVCDEEKQLSLAGIKGGLIAQIDPIGNGHQTEYVTDILVEVGNFDPANIRKTSKLFKINTDSTKRFENDLSPELCEFAMKELSGLFVEYGFTDFEDVVDIYPVKQEKREIVVSTAFVNKKLGSNITDDEVENILKRYRFSYKRPEGGSFVIDIPTLRLDLQIPEDMVDEIGRIYGYEKIEPVLPSFDFPQTDNEIYTKIQNVRSVLIAQGYKEVMTYVFADTGEVKVLNSASNKKALRANLKDGVKKAYDLNKQNMAVLGLDEIKIFEIGSVFMKDVEEVRVCFNLKKEIKEMKLEDFSISLLSEKEIFNPQVKIPTTENSFFAYKEDKKQFKMWSVYPFITRDIAFWANEESYKKFQICAADFAKKYCSVAPRMFDTFTKEGKTSYAYRFVFQSFEKTLTDIEVDIQWKEFALEISKIPNIEIR